MNHLPATLKQFITIFAAFIIMLGVPAPALAESTSADPAILPAAVPTVPANNDQAKPAAVPTGAAAGTYTFNAGTGLWENPYYTWNPATGETIPKTAPEYTYNQQTGLWESAIWQFDTGSSSYVHVPLSVATPPAGAITHGGPAPVSVSETPHPTIVQAQGTAGQSYGTVAAPASSPSPASSSASSAVAPISTGTPEGTISTITPVTNVTMNTVVTSGARSGDALVADNHRAGDATSGNALASATILNLLQSGASLTGSGLATFTKEIQGDVTGDILIDPAALIQPAAGSATGLYAVSINSQFNGAIQNDIDLSAISGTASVTGNRRAGDATTGNADAVANVLNLINSVIAANQSFLGVINIYGNLSGDILVPADSLNALLGDNGPSASDTTTTGNSHTNHTTSQQITNNTDLAATSGNALVQDNRRAGDATSGNALTKLTILNLTGHQVNAANSLLVFVNVLGTWIGVIMDAPAGATSAALTGGDTTAGTAPDVADTTDVNTADSMRITNNITAHAQSGDATVANNRRAGSATTGHATASANIVNIMNSQFSLSHWFGVLFINVFGSWHGNFGTAAKVATTPATTGGTGSPALDISTKPEDIRVFRFIPDGDATTGITRVSSNGAGSSEEFDQYMDDVSAVLSDEDVITTLRKHVANSPQVHHQEQFSLAALPLVLGLTGLSVVGAERIKSIRSRMSRSIRR